MVLDPFAMAMGKAGNNAGLGGIGKIMGTAEDPLQLHKSGYFYSPWTNMQLQQEDEDKRKKEQAVAFANAMGTGT